MIRKFAALLSLIIIFSGCSKDNDDNNNVVIPPVVESVTIGSQVWMKTNLDVDHYRNGDSIPQVTDFDDWQNLKTGAWMYYDFDSSNNKLYGKLYNWYAVNDSRGLAPDGWHVPSDSEWTILTTYLGGADVAGGKMKETGTEHWISPNNGADNSSGFTALPAGTSTTLIFWQQGYNTYWWSTDSFDVGDETDAIFRAVYNNSSNVNRSGTLLNNGFSVRCIKD